MKIRPNPRAKEVATSRRKSIVKREAFGRILSVKIIGGREISHHATKGKRKRRHD